MSDAMQAICSDRLLRLSVINKFPSVVVALLILLSCSVASAAEGAEHGQAMGNLLPLVTVTPFVILLLAIAVMPLTASHWWEHNKNKGIVAAVLAVPLAIYLATQFGHDGTHRLFHTSLEYVSFIALLGSLFVISGGVYVKGSLSGTPLVNTAVLTLGAAIASIVGTTGASVLLIRPLLRANNARQSKVHVVVFFIFIVSNCGGLLTPLGDPPLFLGFLRGVPFTWTFRLWGEWLLVNGALLVIFNIWDQIVFNREERQRPGSQLEEVQKHEPLRVLGLHNVVFLAGIVGVIIGVGHLVATQGESVSFTVMQAGAMVLLGAIAYATTAKENRQNNNFGFGPIIEVAVLFAGIFITMIPALEILNVKGEHLGLDRNTPWHFFWATGVLSSFLDNAPTYMTFAATAVGIENAHLPPGADRIALEGQFLATFLTLGPIAEKLLAAISCGAVFMGANTYIGNGPNFMVKAIAEENGVKMPGFFAYMAYSGCILIPLFIVVTFVFFL